MQQPQSQQQFQMPQQQQQIGGCYDTAVNCLENSYFCTQPYYESTMRAQCARTCQFCRETINQDFDSTVCKDVNPECRMWANRGFCDSLFYPEHVKRRYCALSCGYCRPQPRIVDDQAPNQPFADEPTPKTREHTHKAHRTTTPSEFDKDEESMDSTTPETSLEKETEDKDNKSTRRKSKKSEKDDDN